MTQKGQPAPFLTSIAFRAVAISFLLHMAVARFTIITFPEERVAIKPTLFFWGSILSQQDLTKRSQKESAAIRPQNAAMTFGTASQNLPASKIEVPKPAVPSNQITGTKVSYKSTVAEFHDEDPSKEDSLKSLGIDPHVPPRPALKLNPSTHD